jgi:hypothetical protein
MSDLDKVKMHLSKLSADLAPDHELEKLIAKGEFRDLLAPKQPAVHVRYAKPAVNDRDKEERRRLEAEIDQLKKERAELIAELAEADQRLKSLADQVSDNRQSFRTRIRRSKVSQRDRQDGELKKLYGLVSAMVNELVAMRQPRKVTKHIQRDDEGLITRIEEFSE